MADTELEVVNLALNRIGHKSIENLEDGTNQTAVLMKSFYNGTVNEMLSVFPWNCAVTRAELSLTSEVNLTQYNNGYDLPEGVLRVLDIDGDKKKTYRIEGKQIFTDEGNSDPLTIRIRYIQKLSDVTAWDEFLEEAIALRLAEKACMKITKNLTLTSYLQQQVITALNIAQQSANAEDREDLSNIIASINNSKMADIMMSKNNYAQG